MRNAEIINLAFFSFFILAAWSKQLESLKRWSITAVGLGGICISGGLYATQFALSNSWSLLFRDWIPAPLLLIVYWQAGLFAGRPNLKFQQKLEEFDRRFLGKILFRRSSRRGFRWLVRYLEFSYLFCYPLVPLGMGVLSWTHHRHFADYYWTLLLPSTYLCYVLIPFAQTIPPRLTSAARETPGEAGGVRKLNLWILRHWSIQLNTFPSAHVASTMAASLVLLRVEPLIGFIFLLVSLSIGAGAVLGRYHYAADVLLAIVLALAINGALAFFFS